MGKEYEAKFLDVNVSKMRQNLKKIGCKLVHQNKRYVRSVYHRCPSIKGPKYNSFARVRDEGGQVTMTVKIFKDKKFPDEYEVSINEDFDTGNAFMESLNLQQKAFQETYCEKWSINKIPGVHEITFDTIPGLPTYMEVDCTSEKSLNNVINKLELNKEKMRFGAFANTYEEYYGIPAKIINDNTPSLSFANIKNEIKPNKNKDIFKKIILQQYKYVNKNSSKSNKSSKANRTNNLSKLKKLNKFKISKTKKKINKK